MKKTTLTLIAISLIAIGGISFFCLREAHGDSIMIDGQIERADCDHYWTEPVTIICRTETQTCTMYPETGQFSCVQK